jgi:Xaa-Pro aminopeptidase
LLIDYISSNKLKTIALNYTTMNDINTDIIGYGFYKYYTNLLSDSIDFIQSSSFFSAENIIYALIDRKETDEIHKMRVAAVRAEEILMMVFTKIKCGISEIDLIELAHTITKETREDFLKGQNGFVVEETYSWEEEACPIVLAGKSFLKGGHALSSDNKIVKGNTVYFDFGVCLTFNDGSKWSSDIQRTGYYLKDDETEPPKYIQDRFRHIIESITLAINNIKIGMYGYEVDELVRNYLVSKDYPSYDHATGHAIGESAHNPGTNFTTTKSGTGLLKVQPNGTYTIEPRIPLENGVSIEEMILVSESGSVETLCKRQDTIILIKS